MPKTLWRQQLAGIMSSRKRDAVLMDKITKYLEIREGVKLLVAAAPAREERFAELEATLNPTRKLLKQSIEAARNAKAAK